MSSRTKIVRMASIAADPKLGSVMIRLMMIINDFSIANDAVGFWRSDTTRARRNRERDGPKYFVRLQISHIFEGMRIIKEIDDDPSLRALVGQCDKRTQDEFQYLVTFRKSAEFRAIMTRIRHNLTFHYDAGTTEKALVGLVTKNPDSVAPISMGHDALDWYFEPGAMVADRAGVRDIFNIPEGANVQEDADRVLMRLHEIAQKFGGFAGNFIWRHA